MPGDDERQWQKLFDEGLDRFATGRISVAEIQDLAGALFPEDRDIAVNRLIHDCHEFSVVGPVFSHELVGFCAGHTYVFPGLDSALGCFDSYRNPRPDVNLVQARRDYCGVHACQRIDRAAILHTDRTLLYFNRTRSYGTPRHHSTSR